LLAESVIEDEDESTRTTSRGQLPKFGAMEEKLGGLIFRMNRDQENLWRRLIPQYGVRFSDRFRLGRKIV